MVAELYGHQTKSFKKKVMRLVMFFLKKVMRLYKVLF